MNTALAPAGSTLVVPNHRLHIAGLDGLDEGDQAIPYIRVVQPTSTECKLMNASVVAASWHFRVRAITEKLESTKDGQPRTWYSFRFYIIGEADERIPADKRIEIAIIRLSVAIRCSDFLEEVPHAGRICLL